MGKRKMKLFDIFFVFFRLSLSISLLIRRASPDSSSNQEKKYILLKIKDGTYETNNEFKDIKISKTP